MITDEQVKAAYKAYSKAIFIPEYITKQTYKDAMRAALEAAEDAAWRPIEEAPKDGTKVLMFEITKFGPFICSGYYDVDCEIWQFSDPYFHNFEPRPTHFRPLPEPPK